VVDDLCFEAETWRPPGPFREGHGIGDTRPKEAIRMVDAPLAGALPSVAADPGRPTAGVRAREVGIAPGVLQPGALNAITDVAGVAVGHTTLTHGEGTRTGVTAILPHQGNVFQIKVPAGFAVGNGFGKFVGSTQIEELGEIETPIILTNTLSVAEGIAGAVQWTLDQPGNEDVISVNAVVGETNDGYLNDIRSRHVTMQHVIDAITSAAGGPVVEGCVGAGVGTQAFGWKGGIGTSSRLLPRNLNGYTVGVLVQTNYGGILTVMGVPVGQALRKFYLQDETGDDRRDGSVIIVVATDAPLSDRNLRRLAQRAFLGIASTGSCMANGSGDYAIAFSSAAAVRRSHKGEDNEHLGPEISNSAMTPLFQAVKEATEEAVYNAMLQARTTIGHKGRRLERLPPETIKALVDHHDMAR
jgi:D-aminopeptidase